MQSGDYANALDKYRQGVSIRETLLQNADTAVIRTHLAGDYAGLAKAMSATGDLSGALEYSKKAAEILDQLSRVQTRTTLPSKNTWERRMMGWLGSC